MKNTLLKRFPAVALFHGLVVLTGMVFLSPEARGETQIMDEEDMLLSSNLIAMVDIVELTVADKATPYADLNAKAHLTHALKGAVMKTELEFRIPRAFPFAAFDMSTGMHLVFLRMDKSGKFVGTNSFMSYVYLGGKKARCFDKNGLRIEVLAPEELIKRVKERLAEVASEDMEKNHTNRDDHNQQVSKPAT